jgi:hypothetical protein
MDYTERSRLAQATYQESASKKNYLKNKNVSQRVLVHKATRLLERVSRGHQEHQLQDTSDSTLKCLMH